MNIQIPLFLHNEFEEYVKANQDSLPYKTDSSFIKLERLTEKFYSVLYQTVVLDNKNIPTPISIKQFRKLSTNDRYIYFILAFFEQKNYIIPVRTKNGNKSYSTSKKGSTYQFTDQFLNKISNSQTYQDQEINQFLEKMEQEYEQEVEQTNEELLNKVFGNKELIGLVKGSMNRLKELSFRTDQENQDINFIKRLYNKNTVKFNYRIYSPLSATKRIYRNCGWVVNQDGKRICEFYDLHASGFQMLQIIASRKIKGSEKEIKWLDSLFNTGDFYLAVRNKLGFKYKREYMKNVLQWFINSNPAFKQEYIETGCCPKKNKVENKLMELFYKNCPKIFKYLADYETYSDHGVTKSAIWKQIHSTETEFLCKLADLCKFKTYQLHDSLQAEFKFCSPEFKRRIELLWYKLKNGTINHQNLVKVDRKGL